MADRAKTLPIETVPLAWGSTAEPILAGSLAFQLPRELEAGEPPEARGLARDQVRLMVSRISADQLIHSRFSNLGDFLREGDVLAINTSGTLNAALPVRREDGECLELHLSTHLPGNLWVVEARRLQGQATQPFSRLERGERLALPGGAFAHIYTPYLSGQRWKADSDAQVRLWIAGLDLPLSVEPYLDRYGAPIRYPYVHRGWSSSYYQTVYATETGSAEMPSAGRAFTPELITRLAAQGIQFAPLILHTGVASLENHEPPYEEYYRVPAATVRAINAARAAGNRVIAVGTTTVRALETVVDDHGLAHPGEGWTNLVITPDQRLRAIDGLLTGLHEPRSTHLAMLAALAGFDSLQRAYHAALDAGYLWHEFGDLHLILP